MVCILWSIPSPSALETLYWRLWSRWPRWQFDSQLNFSEMWEEIGSVPCSGITPVDRLGRAPQRRIGCEWAHGPGYSDSLLWAWGKYGNFDILHDKRKNPALPVTLPWIYVMNFGWFTAFPGSAESKEVRSWSGTKYIKHWQTIDNSSQSNQKIDMLVFSYF